MKLVGHFDRTVLGKLKLVCIVKAMPISFVKEFMELSWATEPNSGSQARAGCPLSLGVLSEHTFCKWIEILPSAELLDKVYNFIFNCKREFHFHQTFDRDPVLS